MRGTAWNYPASQGTRDGNGALLLGETPDSFAWAEYQLCVTRTTLPLPKVFMRHSIVESA
jgi:hypothetical protein